jgi:AraC-like DNA-binding protein
MAHSAWRTVRERTNGRIRPAVPDPQAARGFSTVGTGAESWELWNEFMRTAFAAARTEPPVEDAAHFDAIITGHALGPLMASTMNASPFQVRRTPQHARRHKGQDFFLGLILEGSGVIAQDGRLARMCAGDFAFVDSARPYLVCYPVATRLVILNLPRARITAPAPRAAALSATTFSARHGVASVLNPMIAALPDAHGRLDEAAAEGLAHNLYDLLATALNARVDPSRAEEGGRMAAHRRDLQRAKRHMRERLHDPELTLLGIGMRLGLSLRYLHQVFREDGTTPQQWIMAARLERAATLLRRGGGPDTVAAMATHVGFKDPSHFTRAFKARYGTTPGTYRSVQRTTTTP